MRKCSLSASGSPTKWRNDPGADQNGTAIAPEGPPGQVVGASGQRARTGHHPSRHRGRDSRVFHRRRYCRRRSDSRTCCCERISSFVASCFRCDPGESRGVAAPARGRDIARCRRLHILHGRVRGGGRTAVRRLSVDYVRGRLSLWEDLSLQLTCPEHAGFRFHSRGERLLDRQPYDGDRFAGGHDRAVTVCRQAGYARIRFAASRRGGEPGQAQISLHREPRDAHAAQRHRRNERPAPRHAPELRAERDGQGDARGLAVDAQADRERARYLQDRGRKGQHRGDGFRSAQPDQRYFGGACASGRAPTVAFPCTCDAGSAARAARRPLPSASSAVQPHRQRNQVHTGGQRYAERIEPRGERARGPVAICY